MIILVVKQASSSMLEWILLVLLIWQVTNNGIKKKLYFDLDGIWGQAQYGNCHPSWKLSRIRFHEKKIQNSGFKLKLLRALQGST